MSNSEDFLGIFSAVEKWLRQQLNADRTTSFNSLVDKAAETDRAVMRYRNDLKEFADLRNAIVHERTDSHVIAEPNTRAITDFQHVRSMLMNPPKVIPKFQVIVVFRTLSETVGEAVADMRKGSFSQIPILSENNVVAVLTSETVVRWLASEVANELVGPWETKIRDVLPHTENKDHYCFLSRNATLLDVLSKFEDFSVCGKHLDAILISQDGKSIQKLIGILTIYDLPEIMKELGLKRMSTT
jgi:predicted transcriptional regulator